LVNEIILYYVARSKKHQSLTIACTALIIGLVTGTMTLQCDSSVTTGRELKHGTVESELI